MVLAAGGASISVTIVADNVAVGLGDGTTDFVRLTGGSALIVIGPAVASGPNATTGGIAARITGTIEIQLPVPIGLTGTFALEINTTDQPVTSSFDLGGGHIVTLDLGDGPYVRVAASNVALTIAGLTVNVGSLVFEQQTLATGERIVTLGLRNASVALGDAFLVNITTGNLLIAPSGLAGRFAVTLAINLPGITFAGRIELVINNGSAPVHRTFVDAAGNETLLDVPGGPFLRVEVSGLTAGSSATLTVAGVTLNGNFVVEKSTTASGQPVVKIGMSQVGLNLGGVVTLSNGQGVILLLPPQVTGKTISAQGSTVNSLTVTGHGYIEGDRVKYVRGGGGAVITGLTDGSVYFVHVLDANTIQLRTTAAGTAVPVTFVATAGTTHTLLKANGAFFGTPVAGSGGVAGSISATVSLNVPGVTFAGNFALKINTTNRSVNDSLTVNGVPIAVDVPNGPYLRVEGTGIQLTVAGITLAGNFAFEQYDPDSTPGNGNEKTVIGASNVRVDLGGVLEVFDGHGVFLVTSGGIAGRLAISVRANFGGVVLLGGTVELELNQTGAVVPSTSVVVGGQTFTIAFADATRLLRVKLTGIGADPAYLEIAGQRLTATSFTFEQQTAKGPDNTLGTADDVRVLRIAATGVGLNLGNGLVLVTGGTLALEVTPAGLAGVVRATVTIGAAGSSLDGIFEASATVTISINQRTTEARFDRSWLVGQLGATAVDAIFGTGPTATLQAGKFLRVEATGITITVLDQFSLVGNFAFEQSTTPGPDHIAGNADDVKVVRIGLTGVALNLVPGVLSLTGGEGLIVLSPGGLAASFAVTPVFTLNSFHFQGTFRVSINNRVGVEVHESFVVGTTVLTLDLPAGPYLRVDAQGVELEIAGQVLRGDFSFEKTTAYGDDHAPGGGDDTSILKIAANNVELRLGDGTTDFVVVTEGTGTFIVDSSGLAGRLSAHVAVNIPGVEVGGTFVVEVNNTGHDVDETFKIGNTDLELVLPAVPQLQVKGIGVFLVAYGQRISGDFVFSRTVVLGSDNAVGGTGAAADRTVVKIGLANVEVRLGDGTNDFLLLKHGTGAFIVGTFERSCPTPAGTPACAPGQTTQLVSGLAGQFSVDIELGPTLASTVSFTGGFRVRINTTGAAVDDHVSVDTGTGTVDIHLALAATLKLSIEGGKAVNNSPIVLTISGQTVTIDDILFSQEQTAAGAKVVKVAITNLRLQLSDGDTVIATIGPINGALLVTNAGIAGKLTIAGPPRRSCSQLGSR